MERKLGQEVLNPKLENYYIQLITNFLLNECLDGEHDGEIGIIAERLTDHIFTNSKIVYHPDVKLSCFVIINFLLNKAIIDSQNETMGDITNVKELSFEEIKDQYYNNCKLQAMECLIGDIKREKTINFNTALNFLYSFRASTGRTQYTNLIKDIAISTQNFVGALLKSEDMEVFPTDSGYSCYLELNNSHLNLFIKKLQNR